MKPHPNFGLSVAQGPGAIVQAAFERTPGASENDILRLSDQRGCTVVVALQSNVEYWCVTMVANAPKPRRVGRPASDVKERIVTTAHRLLREHGAAAVVQTKVAQAAGVPQGHLTYYFPKKSDLLVAVARRFREDTVKEVVRVVTSADPPTSGEERLLHIVRLLGDDRERTRALLGLALEAERHPALEAELQDAVATVRRFLASALGKSEPDSEVDLVLAVFWGLGLQHLLFAETRSADERAGTQRRLERLLREQFPILAIKPEPP